jgi:TIR domain
VAAPRKTAKTKTESQNKFAPLANLAALKKNEPLIFISHDTRDAEIAEAFSDLLAGISTGMLKVFRSSDTAGTEGIEFGEEWYQKVMSRLDDATIVVALLTPRSLERPWIL